MIPVWITALSPLNIPDNIDLKIRLVRWSLRAAQVAGSLPDETSTECKIL